MVITMPDLAKKFDGKKYMWDGKEYSDDKSAEEAAGKYKEDKFEVEVIQEGDSYLVYTRRVAENVEVEGEAPV
jgi:hypothetical protein